MLEWAWNLHAGRMTNDSEDKAQTAFPNFPTSGGCAVTKKQTFGGKKNPQTRFQCCHVRKGLGQLWATWESWGGGEHREEYCGSLLISAPRSPHSAFPSFLEGPLRIHQNNPSLLLHLPVPFASAVPPAEGRHAALCTG